MSTELKVIAMTLSQILCAIVSLAFSHITRAGGFVSLTRSTGNVAVWMDFSREGAALAAATANNYATIPAHFSGSNRGGGPTVDDGSSKGLAPDGNGGSDKCAASVPLTPQEVKMTLLRDFMGVVEAYDAFITHLEVRMIMYVYAAPCRIT